MTTLDVDERIKKLETEVQRLSAARRSEPTAAMIIAIVGALGLAVLIVSKLNVPWASEDGQLGALGVGCAIGSCIVLGIAWGFVGVALRSLVEIAVVIVAFLNWAYGMTIIVLFQPLVQRVSEWNLVAADDLQAATAAGAVGVLFLADVAISLVLYPFARTAGSALTEP